LANGAAKYLAVLYKVSGKSYSQVHFSVAFHLQHYMCHINMSTTTDRNAHYVVLDGMHDDNISRRWVRLLRYGVVFRIDAFADELENTSLHDQWKALVGKTKTQSMASGDVMARWERLCDL
jgi:hypothetical protein